MNGSTDTTGWSTNLGSSWMTNCNGHKIFGGYPNWGTGKYASKNYTGLPVSHYQVAVSVQLAFIDSWDDERCYVTVDGTTVYQESYNTHSSSTEYCGESGENFRDRIKTVTSTPIAHTSSSLLLKFTTNIDEPGDTESFGFNNIQLIFDLCHPGCSACTGPTNADCSSCNSGWYLEGTTCNATCSLQGKYANSTTNKCEGIRLGSFFWINIFEYSM